MQKIKKFFSNIKLLNLLFIFFISLTPLLWFRENEIIVGHDNVFALNPITFLQGRLFAWVEHGFGQSQDLIMGTIPIHLIDAIPYMLGFSLQVTEKIVYIFWFFAIGVSAYILASTINPKSRTFQLMTVLLYQFNFFVLQAWWIGERTKFSAYIALPLIIAVFLKVYRKEFGVIKASIINSIILFFFNAGGLYGLPLYGGLYIAAGFFILFFGLFELAERRQIFKNLFGVALFTVFGYLVINSYFILPAIITLTDSYKIGVSGVGGVNGLIEWANVISANSSFINMFRLQGIAEWYDNPDHPYAFNYLQNPLLISISFLLSFIIFLSLKIKGDREKRKIILYFFGLFLVGLFFSAGTHRPFNLIYEFFMRYIPGFAAAFRSPFYKFAPAIFISASILIAFFADSFHGRKRKFVAIGFVVLILAYHFPYFSGNIFDFSKDYSTRIKIPDYVFNFANWINKDESDGRIVLLPPNNPNQRYSVYDWGYFSFQSLPTLFSNKPTIINNDRLSNDEVNLMNSFYEAYLRRDKEEVVKLARILNVEYILLQMDATQKDESPISLNKNLYKEIVTNDLKFPIVEQFDKWIVYKIDAKELPVVFGIDKVALFYGDAKEVPAVYDFGENGVEGEGKDFQATVFSRNNTSEFYVPDCLVCKDNDMPFIRFFSSSVLPDSPFYKLILLREELFLHKNDTKSLIYDYLGITLKRVSEIRQMIKSGKKIDDSVLQLFENAVVRISSEFDKLSALKEKLKIASDIEYYLVQEKEALSELIGVYAITGKSVVVIGGVIEDVRSILSHIGPYIFKNDKINNKLYEVNIENEGKYKVFVKKDIASVIGNGEKKISLEIGDDFKNEIIIQATDSAKWIELAEYNFQKGNYGLTLNFPPPQNLLAGFRKSKSDGSFDRKTCYSATFNNDKKTRNYRLKLDYQNNFSNDLQLLMWENRGEERQLTHATSLKNSFIKETYIQNVESNPYVEEIEFELCSSVLNSDLIKDKINAQVQMQLEPTLILVKRGNFDSQVVPISNTKLSPTSYKISFNSESPFLLVFSERFNPGWKLSGFENKHYRVGGFANGWIIDAPGKYNLELEYKPQKIFIFGSVISIVSLISGLMYLIYANRKKNE